MHPVSLSDVLRDVALERSNQDRKYGEQNHPDGTCRKTYWIAAKNARTEYEIAATAHHGGLTWAHVLREEVYEALEEEDPAALRAELVQIAAVAIAWIECLDRRHRWGVGK